MGHSVTASKRERGKVKKAIAEALSDEDLSSLTAPKVHDIFEIEPHDAKKKKGVCEFKFHDTKEMEGFLGPMDSTLEAVAGSFKVKVTCNQAEEKLIFEGEKAEFARLFVEKLREAGGFYYGIDPQVLGGYIPAFIESDGEIDFKELRKKGFVIPTNRTFGDCVTAMNPEQVKLMEAIEKNPFTIAIGRAGTGKTYIAVKYASYALKAGKVKRIIICRPAVVAGEETGFLPGDIDEKYEPYVAACLDILNETFGAHNVDRYREDGIVQIQPLAYMRSRTFHEAFMILDEAQNTTKDQIQMFITRTGFNSKVVISGDIHQTDLKVKENGLAYLLRAVGYTYREHFKGDPELKEVMDCTGVVELKTVLRNPYLTKMMNAFDALDACDKAREERRSGKKAEEKEATNEDLSFYALPPSMSEVMKNPFPYFAR